MLYSMPFVTKGIAFSYRHPSGVRILLFSLPFKLKHSVEIKQAAMRDSLSSSMSMSISSPQQAYLSALLYLQTS
jgi:hypothetical protein